MSSRQKLILILAIMALVGATYGYALNLLLFYDDVPILSWLAQHTWAYIWLQSEAGYYRPLTFMIYKLGMLLPGEHGRIFLHAVNLLWLFVCEIGRLCTEDARLAGIAAALYAVFPFMSKAIPWVTAMGHPMVTTLVLGAIYCALRAEKSAHPRWWVPSLLLAALAPFAHENGVVTGAVVGGFVVLQFWDHTGFKRRLAFASLGLALNVVDVAWRSRLLPLSGMQPLTLAALYPKSTRPR